MSTVQAITSADPRALLRSLAELEYDAVLAFETAVERTEDADIKKQLAELCDHHRRHITDLNLLLVDLKGRPLLEDDFKRILLEDKVDPLRDDRDDEDTEGLVVEPRPADDS